MQCCYGGKETQIDLFNLIRLNDTVESLQERVRSIESNLTDIRSNTQIVVDEIRIKHENDQLEKEHVLAADKAGTTSPHPSHNSDGTASALRELARTPRLNQRMTMRLPPTNSNWKLSLTHSGLRIDTDILSMNDLYNILFSGVRNRPPADESEHEITSPGTSSESTTSSLENAIVTKSHPLWKSKIKTFPLYSMWEPATLSETNTIEPTEAFTPVILDQLLDIHRECFLCLPMADFEDFKAKYKCNQADPLLLNAIFAWTARHAAIYHGLFPGKDPNSVGERFFENSRNILKERFAKSSEVTMQALLIMYTYCIGKSGPQKSEYESEAYLYLGMAIRMCLDMRMHIEDREQHRIQAEKRRRFFWLCFFLETLCSAHSDKPFLFPEEQTHIVRCMECLPHEIDECYFRVQFTKHRFKITQIYREIAIALEKKDPYFSSVTQLDKKLSEWYEQLPDFFQYQPGDLHKRQWKSSSFREQACIKLNIEMNFQLCQLYSAFMETPGEPNSAVGLIAEQNCVRAADTIVELLECWSMLEQRWCHFTLENLMMATSIYSTLLLKNDTETIESAKRHLQKMATVLMKSPVRQQKHVLNLIKQIQQLLQSSATTTSDRGIERPTGVPDSPDSHNLSNSQPIINYPDNSSNVDPHHTEVANYNVITLSAPSHPYSQQPIASTPPMAMNAGRPSDSIAGPSFDISTHLNAGDLFQFTDFVYTPTLMEYDPMEELRQQQQHQQQQQEQSRMRLPSRRPSYPEFVDNRMGNYSSATPDQYMGHSFVYYSDK